MNDQNEGAEHRPVFRLTETGPDIGQQILKARDEVVEDNSLSLGARLMFVRILDLSVRQSSNVRPGVVTISQLKLACIFHVTRRTVWNWKLELVEKRYLWMSSQPMPNAWPVDTYHITAIHPHANTGDKTTAEGLWGNGDRRRQPVRGLGAREPGQAIIPGTGARSKLFRQENSFQLAKKSSILPQNAPASRTGLHLSTETDCSGQPNQIAPGNRKELLRATEPNCSAPPKQIAPGNRKELLRATEPNCSHRKAIGKGSSHFKGGSNPAPPPRN